MSILCVLTPEIKPVKPGFSLAHKPGFTGLKTGGFTRVFGYPGTRVAFPSPHTRHCHFLLCDPPSNSSY